MNQSEQDQASASVPVEAVVTGDGIARVAASARLMAYSTAARHQGRMQLTRNFKATIKGFNADYGRTCKTWDQVAEAVKEIREASR